MFDHLTQKLEGVFRKLRGRGMLAESNIDEALRDVRRALLEADVNYKVARTFIARVRERAMGREVLRSITPGQQVVKVVHDELIHLLGDEHQELNLSGPAPNVVMVVGLQGSGKTTLCAKLARLLKAKGSRPLLVAADVYRPAAIDQLCVLGASIDVPVHRTAEKADPVAICADAVDAARADGMDTVILDTAGRLHVDDERMGELKRIRDRVSPDEILFVADGMTGQDAVSAATAFYEQLTFTGVVLTRLDSDTRGGAALSIREVTGVPIKYAGVSERVDGIEPFHPDRVASRILGMGDVVTLVERAQDAVDVKQAEKLEKKLRNAAFTFDDFLQQLDQVRKMGPLNQLMDLIPGAGKAMKGMQVDEDAFVHTEAIILSMTKRERESPRILNGSRRRRIAKGSGCSIQEVNRLIKQFGMMRRMMKRMSRMEKTGRGTGVPFLG